MNQEVLTIKEIMDGCLVFNVYEKRLITDEYGELVFFNKDIAELNKLLSDMLGPAVKPKGIQPTKEDKLLTKEYGGIRIEQTLFKKDYNDISIIAMLWPWQSTEHTTLKVISIN